LEDRVNYITNQLKSEIKYKLTTNITTNIKKGTKNHVIYTLKLQADKPLTEYKEIVEKFEGKLNGNEIVIIVE
jgi:hypothetical protein